MPFTYHAISTTSGGIVDIKTALTTKYGAYHVTTNPTGLTVLFEDTSYLLFTLPAISNRHLKIRLNASSWYGLYWGTGWTSGNTLVGEVGVSDTVAGGMTGAHLLLQNDMLFFATTDPATLGTTNGNKTWFCGKLSNGDFGIGTWTNSSAATNYNNARCLNTTTTTYYKTLACWMNGFSRNGFIVTQPLYLFTSLNVLVEASGVPVVPNGILNFSYGNGLGGQGFANFGTAFCAPSPNYANLVDRFTGTGIGVLIG